MLRILVVSHHKSLRLLQKLFTDNQIQFVSIDTPKNSLKDKIDIIIIDENEYKKHKSLNGEIATIILKNTQKSDASILALSGQLSTFGQNHQQEFLPFYIVDFIVAISLSILIRQIIIGTKNDKKSNTFNVSLIDFAKYFGAFNISAKQNGFLKNLLGKNLLDGGAPFYRLYKCKDSIVAVGNLEPKFYQQMIKAFKLNKQEQSFLIKNQFNLQKWPKIQQILSQIFIKKTASQWQNIMKSYDTCVTQVVQNSPEIEIPQPKISPLIRPKL